MSKEPPHQTTIAEAWEYYAEMIAPPPEELHGLKRAFYAAALSSFNIVFNALEKGGAVETFKVIQDCHEEAKKFAMEQIKLHSPNVNN